MDQPYIEYPREKAFSESNMMWNHETFEPTETNYQEANDSYYDANLCEWLAQVPEFGSKFSFSRPTSKSSLEVFSSFIRFTRRNTIDASQITGRDCYEAWLRSRTPTPKFPEESFRKTLTWLLVKDENDKVGFPEDVRQAIIDVLTVPGIWPCFVNRTLPNGKPVMIGAKGLRVTNFQKDDPNKRRRVHSV